MKKLLSLVLCAAMALAVLASCQSGTPGGDTGTAPVTEAESTKISLAEAGKALLTLIRPDEAGEDMIALVKELNLSLPEKCGVQFTLATDWIKRGTELDSSAKELLFGCTNRPETENAAQGLGFNGYTVKIDGGKLVVFGNTLSAQKKALEYLLNNVVSDGEGSLSLTLPAGGYTVHGDDSLTLDAGTVKDYVVVAPSELSDAAATLVKAITKKTGVTLTVKLPTDGKAEKEILIGDCGRSETDAALNELSTATSYKIKSEANKIMIVGKNNYATKLAVDTFCSEYVKSEYSPLLMVPDGNSLESDGINPVYAKLTDGADIRVLSFNILAELWNDQLPIEGRDNIVASVIMTYLPDVAGIQEMTERWYTLLPDMISDEYDFICPDTTEGNANYSTLIYNKKKLKLIDSGMDFFSQGNSRKLRLMTWGVFETIDGGKRFAAMSTHWDINNSTGVKNAFRLVQSGEMAAKVLELEAKYSCPVICTGDYNSSRSSEEFLNYIEASKTSDAQVDADVKVNDGYNSTHSVGSAPSSGSSAIDHITYTSGARALFFNLLKDPLILDASDHDPIYADFALTSAAAK